jgi:hypothetical protein
VLAASHRHHGVLFYLCCLLVVMLCKSKLPTQRTVCERAAVRRVRMHFQHDTDKQRFFTKKDAPNSKYTHKDKKSKEVLQVR